MNSFRRLCGRIFCYYCSNNFVTTKHSGKKERCCRECYSQHGDVVERFTRAELGPAEAQTPPDGGAGPESHPQPAPYKPTPRVTGDWARCVHAPHRSAVCAVYTTRTVRPRVLCLHFSLFSSVHAMFFMSLFISHIYMSAIHYSMLYSLIYINIPFTVIFTIFILESLLFILYTLYTRIVTILNC